MIDKLSDTWLDVAKTIDAERAKLNDRLLSPAVDFSDTQFIRGQIEALSMIKQLPDKQSPPKLEIESYN